MPAVANLVWETTTDTGTGPFTVAASGQTFNNAFGTGGTDTFDVFMRNRNVPTEWMVATGHLSDATTLVIDTVIEGSNGTSEVSWSAGTKDVTNDLPASLQRGRGVGEFFWYLADSPPDYALELDGSAVSRTTYAELWTWVQASGNLAASEGAKLDGEFGPGDGSTTFTLPDLITSSRFIRAATTVGAEQLDAFQGHVHPQRFDSTAARTTGASIDHFQTGTADSTGFDTLGPSTDGVNGTPRTASETRPTNVALLPCVVF
jgi:hypothetical protein